MADISKITLPSGSTYDIKDATARASITAIEGALAGGVSLIGTTTTALTDNATTPTTITVNGNSVNVTKGNLVIYSKKEFLWDGTKWIELGDLGAFKALAYKDSASATYTPAGTVSTPTFTGSATTSTGKFTPSGSVTLSTATTTSTGAISYISALGTKSFSGTAATIKPKVTAAGTVAISKGTGTANYTPEGTVAAPTISVKTAGSTTTVNSITDVGTLPTLTTTVANEVLTIGFDRGALPTKGANTTVKTGDAAYQATAPAFTGTGAELKATFTGTEVEGTASYTPAGNITVNATTNYLKGSFTGTEGNVSVSGTPNGTISQPTFTGTQATITVT